MTRKVIGLAVVAIVLSAAPATAADRYAGLTKKQAVAMATRAVSALAGRKVPKPTIVRRVVYFDCQIPNGAGCPKSRRVAWYVYWRGEGCVYVSKRFGVVIGPPCRWH